jgi:cobalt-zinc-cadmium efflux system membrane fusion protein
LAACAVVSCSGETEQKAEATAEQPAGVIDTHQAQRLGITTETVQAADSIPLASVPGQVTLPPEARVAVTSPFPGAAVRVYVIEGQEVGQGQPLALIRAAEPVQIRGELARSEAEMGLAAARARRLKQLSDEGIIAASRTDEAEASLAQARASVTQSRRLLSLAGAGPDGTMALRAPISGRVAHVAIETGSPVDPSTAPFMIENTTAYRIDLQLPERLVRSVSPGMPIEVDLGPGPDGKPLLVSGRILSVTPSIDPTTRSAIAKATIGTAPGLMAGKNVSVIIKGGGTAGAVTVPSSAVTRIGDKPTIFVRQGKLFAPRSVDISADAAGRSVVTSGLRPGDTVAISGIAELKAMLAE